MSKDKRDMFPNRDRRHSRVYFRYTKRLYLQPVALSDKTTGRDKSFLATSPTSGAIRADTFVLSLQTMYSLYLEKHV